MADLQTLLHFYFDNLVLKFSKPGREHLQRTLVTKCESLILLHALTAHFQRTKSVCISGRWINVFFQDILLLGNMCISNLTAWKEKPHRNFVSFDSDSWNWSAFCLSCDLFCLHDKKLLLSYHPRQKKETFYTYSDLWILFYF